MLRIESTVFSKDMKFKLNEKFSEKTTEGVNSAIIARRHSIISYSSS